MNSFLKYFYASLIAIFVIFALLPNFSYALQQSGEKTPDLKRCPDGSIISVDKVCPLSPSERAIQLDFPQDEGAGGRAVGSIPGSGRTQTIILPNPLKATSFAELTNRITNWLLIIGAPILVLMIIIGAFQIMTGAGNPENITKGRHTITWAIIGYALLLISSGITLIIEQLLGIRR